jgi:hypothetical protein
VARQDDGAALVDVVAQHTEQALRRHGVDRFEGLVEHEQARGVDHRAGEHELLRHARRVVADGTPERGHEVERFGQLGRPLAHLPARQPPQRTDVVEELLAGEPVEGPHAVGQDAHEALRRSRILARVDIEDADLAAIRANKARNHRQGRGLSRAVRPDETVERPGGDAEIDARHRRLAPVRLDHSAQLERVLPRRVRHPINLTILPADRRTRQTDSSGSARKSARCRHPLVSWR